MIQSALLGGVFIGVLSALPFVNVANCCCLWVVGGGFLAAYLQQQNEGRSLRVGRGALVGLTAGIAGAVVWLLVSVLLDPLVGPLQQRMVEEMLGNATDMPPQARVWLEAVGERASSPFRYVLGFTFNLFRGMVFAAIGGAIGAAFFRRDAPPALGGDPMVPPLPPHS